RAAIMHDTQRKQGGFVKRRAKSLSQHDIILPDKQFAAQVDPALIADGLPCPAGDLESTESPCPIVNGNYRLLVQCDSVHRAKFGWPAPDAPRLTVSARA